MPSLLVSAPVPRPDPHLNVAPSSNLLPRTGARAACGWSGAGSCGEPPPHPPPHPTPPHPFFFLNFSWGIDDASPPLRAPPLPPLPSPMPCSSRTSVLMIYFVHDVEMEPTVRLPL